MHEDELRNEYDSILDDERAVYRLSNPLAARHQHSHDHLMWAAASQPTNPALHLNELWEHFEQHHRDHEFSDMYNRNLWDLWHSHNLHHYSTGHDTLGEVDAARTRTAR